MHTEAKWEKYFGESILEKRRKKEEEIISNIMKETGH
jgi:hypothetical protein